MRNERHEEVLDAASGFGGYAQAVGHVATVGFDFERDDAHKAVSRQLAQKSDSGLWRKLRTRQPFDREERIFAVYGVLGIFYSGFAVWAAIR